MKVYVFLAEGFEEIEATNSIDILRRSTADVKIVSIMDKKEVKGAWGVTISADMLFDEVSYDDGDMVVLPGGGLGYDNLSKHKGVHKVLVDYNNKGKWIGAICAAPMVLGELSLLEGKKATCYPGCEKALSGAVITGDKVTIHDNIITGKGPLAAGEFGLKLVEVLYGEDKVEKLKEEMIY